MGSTMTLGPMDATTSALPESGTVSTLWIPRAVRCRRCGDLAREEVRERMSDTEVAVRYGCRECRWHQTRHYFEGSAETDRD